MEFRMEIIMLIVCVIATAVEPITISPNGNSPEVKMIGGVTVDVEKGFVPMTMKSEETAPVKTNYEKSRRLQINSTNLALNERYRRLIPYMTFYYANDVATSTTDSTMNVEVEKAQIMEAKEIPNQRQPKKIVHSQRNIPRYQGNRLTHYNVASANPIKIFYKDGVPVYQSPSKVTPNYNPLLSERPHVYNYDSGRITLQKIAPPGVGYTSLKRPYINLYNEDTPNIRYYLTEKEQNPKYKLVPYEQTPPVKVAYAQAHVPTKISYESHIPRKEQYEQAKVVKLSFDQTPFKLSYDHEESPQKVAYSQNPVKLVYDQTPVKSTYTPPVKVTHDRNVPQSDIVYEPRKPVVMSVLVPKELYVKPRPVRPYNYDSRHSHPVRKQPATVSESYYEKLRPQTVVVEPDVESGFKPIANPGEYTTQANIYTSTIGDIPHLSDYEIVEQSVPLVQPTVKTPDTDETPNYYQYVIEQQKHKPSKETPPSAVTLASLLNSLQVNKSIPMPITRENVDSSIKTLLQVLNSLKAQQNTAQSPVLSTPKPFVGSKVVTVVNEDEAEIAPSPEALDPELHEEPYLAQVNTPSQHLDDDHSLIGGTSQQFPLPVTSDDEGGTPGQPGVDYPILTSIPHTTFACKSQRYKGFFADTETRCQVWHYCDLNGGQASFLCPNGTIFSQAGLTCDWWFNVRCDSTTQLYVLNESLYKYILPHSPKFPEDYSGPLVDKYLTLKFKEMEEELKKKKNKENEQKDSEEDDKDSSEDPSEDMAQISEMDKRQLSDLSEASVIVEYPGGSGKVARLEDE